jgi:hypothetical protein
MKIVEAAAASIHIRLTPATKICMAEEKNSKYSAACCVQ